MFQVALSHSKYAALILNPKVNSKSIMYNVTAGNRIYGKYLRIRNDHPDTDVVSDREKCYERRAKISVFIQMNLPVQIVIQGEIQDSRGGLYSVIAFKAGKGQTAFIVC